MYDKLIRSELHDAMAVLDMFINQDVYVGAIEKASKIIVSSFKEGGKVLSCGNGGSHCNAIHFAEELTGRYRNNRSPYPAVAISDSCYISCVGNDFGYEHIFSRYVEALGFKNDILFSISTSAKSFNILKAIEVARSKNMKVIVLSGGDGGVMSSLADVEIRVPYFGYVDRIQEIHIKVIHILILLIEKQMESSILK